MECLGTHKTSDETVVFMKTLFLSWHMMQGTKKAAGCSRCNGRLADGGWGPDVNDGMRLTHVGNLKSNFIQQHIYPLDICLARLHLRDYKFHSLNTQLKILNNGINLTVVEP